MPKYTNHLHCIYVYEGFDFDICIQYPENTSIEEFKKAFDKLKEDFITKHTAVELEISRQQNISKQSCN